MRPAVVALALALGLAGAATPARGAPATSLVVVWTPGEAQDRALLEAASRGAGAAVLDVSAPIEVEQADRAALRAGQVAYEELRFSDAVTALSRAAESLERSGGAGLTQHELADVFFLRALAQVQLGAPEAAWDDLVRAAVLAPTRVLDPGHFPPRAVEQLERARAHVLALPRPTVRLTREPGCAVVLDGSTVTEAELALVRGHHYLVATCPSRRPRQQSFELLADQELATAGAALVAPADDGALVQARALGVRELVIATASGRVALLRRLGIDGRERARGLVQLAAPNAREQLDRELARLLTRGAEPTPWYRSRWAWAAAGVVAASAVLVPLVLQSDDPATVVIRPEGGPW